MERAYIKIEKGTVSCHRFGRGAKLIIALHGFGDQANSFSNFEKTLGDHYTIIAPDLPFHGETEWLEDSYQREDFIQLIEQILKLDSWQTFDLVGHSLGGTIALSIATHFDKHLEYLILLAPSGIAVKSMAIPNLIPVAIRLWIAKYLKTGFILNLAERLKTWGGVNAYSVKFLHHHLGDSNKQKRLMHTWVSEYYFRLKISTLKRSLSKREKEKTYFILGTKDPLVSSSVIEEKLGNYVNIQQIESGHRMINAKTAVHLKKLLII